MANYVAPTKAAGGQLSHTEFNLLAGEAQELSAAMPGKAPAASPTFTGTVTVPDGSFTIAKTTGLQTAIDGRVPTSRTVTAGTGLTGGGDLTANRSLAVTYGTTAGTAAQGNDTRLSDARTPTSHAASHASGGADALAISGAQVTSGTVAPARLGTGAATSSTVLYGDGTWKAAPAGGSTQVVTSGPYTLDPQRTPAGMIALVPAGEPVLTHHGNRWTNAGVGTAASSATQSSTGTLVFSLNGSPTYASSTVATGSTAPRALSVTGSTTAATKSAQIYVFPTGNREVRASLVTRLPRPTTGDHNVAILTTSASDEVLIVCSAATDPGEIRLAINSITSGSGWEVSNLNVATGAPVRISFAGSLSDTASASRLSVAIYAVQPDGSEVQIGTTWTNNALTFAAGTTWTQMQWGKLSTISGMESQTFYLDAARAAFGTGAGSAHLQAEYLYPEAN